MSTPARPQVGPAVPLGALAAASGLVAAGLVLAAFPGVWLLALAVGALVVVRPAPVLVVGLVLVLAGVQALQPMVPVQPRFFALLAGVHLLHVLTALVRALPRHGWLQLAALARPLGRWAVVQAGAQLLALAVLLSAGRGGGLGGLVVPALGVVGAAVLLVTALALLRPLLRRGPG